METGAKGLEHSVGQARLRKALRRGLSLDPAQRFPSMGALLAEIEPSIGRRGGWIVGAVLLALLPATATLIGLFVLAQLPTPTDLAGIGLIILGVAVHEES